MLYIIDDKSDYHDKLKDADIGFLFKPSRAYFVVYGLKILPYLEILVTHQIKLIK